MLHRPRLGGCLRCRVEFDETIAVARKHERHMHPPCVVFRLLHSLFRHLGVALGFDERDRKRAFAARLDSQNIIGSLVGAAAGDIAD